MIATDQQNEEQEEVQYNRMVELNSEIDNVGRS